MGNEVRIHRRVEEIDAEWDALAGRARASPFAHPGWVAAWWRAFGSGALEVVALRRDGELAAVLPLRRVAGVHASTTNWHTPVYGPVAADPEAGAALFEWLVECGHRHISLSHVDRDDPALGAFTDAARRAGYRVVARPRLRSPYLPLDGAQPPLSGKRRRDLRRRRRLLEERGHLWLDVADGRTSLDELLDEGLAIEALGWKGTRGTAIAARPQTRRFYRDIARWAAARGWLRLCFLRLDDRAIAFDLGLADGTSHFLLKTGYDPDMRTHAPGVLLRQDAIEHARGLGLQTYEFLGAEEPTKLEWTNRARERVLAQAFRRSPAGTVDWVVSTRGRRFAKQLRDRVAPASLP
jgi:CelD/BcsL family acetyltransferase involved in cellulose biosynthesis